VLAIRFRPKTGQRSLDTGPGPEPAGASPKRKNSRGVRGEVQTSSKKPLRLLLLGPGKQWRKLHRDWNSQALIGHDSEEVHSDYITVGREAPRNEVNLSPPSLEALKASSISLDMNDLDDYPDSRPKRLEWLASRGLCDPETAAEYVGCKLLSQGGLCPGPQGISARHGQLRACLSCGLYTSQAAGACFAGILAHRLWAQHHLRALCSRSQPLLDRLNRPAALDCSLRLFNR
jgi:hypothetical protein